MAWQLDFYDDYGVEEYYEYDPDNIAFKGWIRSKNRLCPIEEMADWISPVLQIRFDLQKDDLFIFGPGRQKFLLTIELDRKYQAERQRTEPNGSAPKN